jgi:hypothetical protein
VVLAPIQSPLMQWHVYAYKRNPDGREWLRNNPSVPFLVILEHYSQLDTHCATDCIGDETVAVGAFVHFA